MNGEQAVHVSEICHDYHDTEQEGPGWTETSVCLLCRCDAVRSDGFNSLSTNQREHSSCRFRIVRAALAANGERTRYLMCLLIKKVCLP